MSVKMSACNCTIEHDPAYRYGVKHETSCPRYHPPVAVDVARDVARWARQL